MRNDRILSNHESAWLAHPCTLGVFRHLIIITVSKYYRFHDKIFIGNHNSTVSHYIIVFYLHHLLFHALHFGPLVTHVAPSPTRCISHLGSVAIGVSSTPKMQCVKVPITMKIIFHEYYQLNKI